MNKHEQIIYRNTPRLAITLLLCIACTAVFAQKPEIRSIDKNTNSMTEVVSIKGSNFGIDKLKLRVFFGGVQAVINTASDQLIEVQVPAGATHDFVSVTRTDSGLTGYSNEQFLLSFGSDGSNTVNLEGHKEFPGLPGKAESVLYDLCLCDFNGDKKSDIATANRGSLNISILENISTPGNVNFNFTNTNVGINTLHLKCGDLNGDGFPDIVAVGALTGNTKILVLKNNGSGSFTTQIIQMTMVLQKVKIADMDADGKPEIIVSHSQKPMISILRNISSIVDSDIKFDVTPVTINIPDILQTDALDVADLDGDNLPEIVTSQYQIATDIIIMKNTGALTFSAPILRLSLNAGSIVTNIRVGDLDGDKKPDLAAILVLSSEVAIFRNTSLNNSLSFVTTAITVPAGSRPYGLDFGDLNGDSKPDIVITHLSTTDPQILNILINKGSLAFQSSTVPTLTFSRYISIGDTDGDGKPDLVFTSIKDNPAATTPLQQVSVIRNATCMFPKITPLGPLNVCNTGTPLKLSSNVSGGATYVWKKNGTNDGASNPFYNVPTTSATPETKYSLVVSPQAGGVDCSSKDSIKVTVSNGSAAAPVITSPSLNPVSTVCLGSEIAFKVTPVASLTYKWSGPAGYTGTGATSDNVITSFKLENAGRYTVDVMDGTCVANHAEILVQAIDAQNFTASLDGTNVFCEGTRTLTVSPTPPIGSTYKWFEKDNPTPKSTSSSYVVPLLKREYFAEITIPSCGTALTPKLSVMFVSRPFPDFSTPNNPLSKGCAGEEIQFKSLTTNIDPDVPATYEWSFSNAPGSALENPTHIFSNPNNYNVNYNVTLAVSYNNACKVPSAPKGIEITPAPDLKITTPLEKFKFCDGEKLKLQVLGNDFISFKWNTLATTSFIEVTEPGEYSVVAETSSCKLTYKQSVEVIKPNIVITADPKSINEGGSAQLTATGLLDYSWSPIETLTNSNIPNPVASPLTSTTYVVTGKDINDCTGKDSVLLEVKGDPIINKLKPGNFFSPNGSEPNETWTIDKIEDYPQCNVVIYDDKGIKVYEAKPYNNDWKGTFNGKKLPEGVYYYIIRCDGEESKTKSGSITLLR